MGNPLNTMGPVQVQQPNLNILYQQFCQNPIRYLTGMNIPQGMTNPQQIVQFLADNGKVPPQLQPRVNMMLGRSGNPTVSRQ